MEGGQHEAASAKTDRQGRVRPISAGHAGAKRRILTASADQAAAIRGGAAAGARCRPRPNPALPRNAALPRKGGRERLFKRNCMSVISIDRDGERIMAN